LRLLQPVIITNCPILGRAESFASSNKVGIFGRITKLDAKLEEGSRIEIYRPITVDPELVERRDTGDDDEN